MIDIYIYIYIYDYFFPPAFRFKMQTRQVRSTWSVNPSVSTIAVPHEYTPFTGKFHFMSDGPHVDLTAESQVREPDAAYMDTLIPMDNVETGLDETP